MRLRSLLYCSGCAFALTGLFACAEVRPADDGESTSLAARSGSAGSAGSQRRRSTARTDSEGMSAAARSPVPGEAQPVQPSTPGHGPTTPPPAARAVCVDGRCVCPAGENACVGDCLSLDDAGTDTCEQAAEETANGCPRSGCHSTIAISAGDFHSCILLADHTVMCWGMNTLGENNSSIAKKTPPELVEGLSDIQAYQPGRAHTCFVRSAAPAQCFGINYQGQLGDGTKNSTAQPVAVKLEGKPVAFGLGQDHSCAVLSDGSVHCWGLGLSGQLGDGKATETTTPQPVPGVRDAIAISSRAGIGSLTCVLSADRTVKCWGSSKNRVGVNGLPGAVSAQLVKNLEDVANIASGETGACALVNGGTVKCWTLDDSVASSVENLRNVTAIAGGNDSTCALLGDRTVRCWGTNGYGNLGDGVTASSAVPVKVVGLEDVKLLAAGAYHYCAVKLDNSVRCWGANWDYQLGDGSTQNSNVPVTVRFPND
jgi:alpha-tubulin suppressor-like RCC1 family protein